MKQFSSLHPIAAFTSSLKKILLLACFGLVSILGWSANISITSNTDWSTINSGSGPGGQPNASDNITVKNGAILTIDVNNALCGNFRIGDGNPSGGNGTLSFDANSQLTISGSFTIGGNQGGTQYTGSINMTNGGLLLIGSALISPAGGGLGTFTPGTGTIEYYLAGAQTVFNFGTAYNNLTLSGSGSKTTSTSIVINGVLSMEGTATASNSVTYGPNATLQYNTATARTIIGTGNNGIEWTTPFTATGGVVIANTGAITLSTNARSFNSGSKLTINAGATFSPGTPTTNTFFGGSSLIINGTLDFTAANGRILSGTSGTSTIIMGTTGLIRTLDPNGLGPNTNASFQTQPGGTWSDNIATVGTVEYYRNTATGVITDRDYNNLIITGTAFAKTWTLTANRNVAGTVTVSGTFTLANTGGPWTINVGGDWTNNGGTFTQSTATLNFNSTTTNQSINGTATSQSFNGITVNKSGRTLDIGGSTTTVTLNSASSVSAGTLSVPAGKTLVVAAVLSNNVAGGVSIAGTFRIDQGGFGGGTNDFTYISGSTLIYNYTQTSTYGPVDATHRYWPASGPTNVVLQMQNTAAINAGALQMGVPRTITGTLSTSNANTRTMTFDLNGNNFQAGALTVGTTAPLVIGSTATTTITGNVSINAALTINGDLYVGGNWTKASSAITFTPNGKAVFFNGTNNTQTIAITGAGTETFAYLVVDKATGGNLTLSSSPATNVTVNASTGDVLQIINAGGIDLNGQTLTLSGSGGNIRVTGGVRTITGTAGSKLAITTGTKTVASTSGGTLELGANVTLETSTGIDFGAGITTVKGTFRIISGGFASGNTAPIYDNGSTLEIANGANFALYGGSNEAAGWFRNVASTGSAQQGIPWNFKVSGSGTNVFYNAVVDNLPRYVNGSIEIVTGNTFSLGGDLYLRGDFIRAGTFNAGSYRVTFNGANQATTGTITFTDLTLAGTGTKTFGAAVTVTGNLTINSGVIANLGTFSHTAGTMTMGGTGTPNGTHGSTSSAATYKNNTYFAPTTGIITVGSSTCGVTANLPAAACRNTTITITGTNFTAGATNTVTFTGASGVASEVTTTATSLQVIIPSAATTGTITIVNGNGCSVTTASYTVNTAPSITGQPSSPAAVCAGTNSSNFTVTATGTSLTYQWQRGISGVYTDITAATTPNDGATYSNFNTATLTVTNAPAGMNGYTYRVVVSGACSPSATSNGAATLTVNTAPNITGQPTSPAAVCAGTNSSNFSVTASGAGLTYQWQRGISGVYTNITAATTPNDGATYSNFNTATLTVTNAPTGMNGYTYRVVVSGTCTPAATSDGTATLTVNTAPNITGQPTSPAAVCAGTNSSSFSVTATGAGLTYQWQRGISGVYTNITAATTPNDGATYSNFNTATLTVTNAPAGMNGYTYRVVVSGTCTPAATSDGTAILTVNAAPNITGQPASPAAVCAGTNSSNFTVTATGTSLTYQWQRGISGVYTDITAATTPNDGATYSNFNTATLTVANAPAGMNGYTYRVVVSGACSPSATSNGAATLTVNTAPNITGQPTSPAAVCAGTNSSNFSVTATGTSLTYQWQRGISGVYTNITAATTPNDGATYSNFNTATLTVTNAPAGMNGYTYRVVVSGTCTPAATSDGTATLTVNTAPNITGQPSSPAAVCAGTNSSNFTVTATGTSLTYQWQRGISGVYTNITAATTPNDGATYSNFNTATLTVANAPAGMNGYTYRVVVSGTCTPSATSNGAATLTVNTAPNITGQPTSPAAVCAGTNSSSFSVTATGAGLTYQWQRGISGVYTNITAATTPNDGATYSNFNTATLTVTNAPAGMNGYTYRVVVSGTCTPAATSDGTATLAVNATSAVGAVSANQTICSGNSPADMTIASATGTIQWQRADNAGFTTNLTNVGTNSTTLTSAQTGGPFTANRFFRAVVTNGVCPSVTSGTITVTVNIPSAVGAVSADQTICSGSTPANMTIASATGTIQWQRADDAGFTTNLTNVGTSSTTLTGAQSGGAATITHYFRAVVTSGVCPPVTSATITVTVNATSAVGAVSADQTICTNGTPADISIASATGTIQWQRGNNTNFTGGTTNIGSNSTTLTSAEIGALTATRYFRAIVTNGVCPSVTSAIVTVTVNPQPAGPGLNVKTPNLAAICTGQTVSATFNSGTGGVGCSDDYIVIIDGGSPVAYTPGSPVGGTATSSIVIQGRRSNCDIAAECNGTNYTTLASWTVNDQPVGPTLNVKTPNIATVCTGSVVSATFNAGSGGTGCADDYVLIIDGGAPVAYTPGASVGAGANSSIVIQGRRASCTAGAGCAGTGYVTLASWAVTNTNTWTGSSSNSWNDAGNWSCSYVPVTTNDVIINNAGNPVLDVNYTVGGSFTMNATSTLTINPNIKLTISAPAVFNDQLVTIKSDVTGTGSIGQIDTVSNPDKAAMKLSNVTVERYIPGDRSWRLLTMPVQGTNTIRDAWANGKAPSNGPDLTNPTGRGTLITGQGYNSFAAASALPGWYDYIGSGLASSIRRYAPTVTGGSWPATIANTPNLTTTMTEAFSDRAYLLFIRGDRTRTTQTIGNPTTLSPNGSLNIGTISYAIPGTAVHKYEVFGNPYPATIDFEDLMNNAGNSSVIDPDRLWIWNPLVSLNGGYNLVKRVAGTWFLVPTDFNTNPGTANPSARYIQSSQGFIVEPITPTPGVLQFAETNKADAPGTPPVVFDASGNGLLFSNLEYDNSGSLSLADGNLAVFADGFSKNVSDKNDVGKIINSSDNFGLTRDGVRLAMEAHPLVVAEDTLYYYMANTSVRAYALRFKAAGMRPGLTAILHDVFLNKESPVDLTDNVITTYKFAVTSNSASAATGRFYITFKANQVLPVTLTSARAFQANAGVQVDWQTVNEQDIRMYEVEKSVDGLLFTKAGTVLAANAGTGNYNWFDATPANGNNYYRIKTISNDGTVSYSQVMLVKMGANIVGSFRVYPNPLKGRVIGLQFTNMEKGQYTVKLFSQVGQLISSRNINLLGGSSSHEIKLDNSLSSGIYKLSLQGKNGFVQQETIVIQN